MSGRVDVEADNVLEFLCELGIVRQLERSDATGGELMGLKDALHRSQTHARRVRQHPAGPMAGFPRRRRERQIDHSLHRGRRQRRLAGFARLVDAFGHETSLPAPHHRLGLAGSAHDLGRAAAVGRCKDDFGAPDMLLRRVAIGHNRLKRTAIVRVTLTVIPALIMRA
jgi:hypothetical protein